LKILFSVLFFATALIFSCADYPRIDEMERTPIYGAVLTDSRDNQTYQTVIIGNQTWMARNLNYSFAENSSSSAENSSSPAKNGDCYGGDKENCEIYGRLYDWATVMGLPEKYNNSRPSTNTLKPTGICPSGWYLPSDMDWQTLVEYVGTNVGVKLKAMRGWSNETDNGDDIYGFSAMPSGQHNKDSGFDNLGQKELGYWWSSTESESRNDSTRAYFRDIGYINDALNMASKLASKTTMFAVRCIKK